MQYYALVAQENTGKVLVFKKLTLGYFFSSRVLIPEGTALKGESGAGQWVFPGGGQEREDKDAATGAIREFKEETGVPLDARLAFQTVTSQKFPSYVATLFALPAKQFDDVYQQALLSLAAAKQAVAAIGLKTITKYEQIQQQFPTCPGSNELDNVRIFDLTSPKDKQELASVWTVANKLDWYREMAENYAGKF